MFANALYFVPIFIGGTVSFTQPWTQGRQVNGTADVSCMQYEWKAFACCSLSEFMLS